MLNLGRTGSQELISTEEYILLSAELNYQLSARELNRQALLELIIGDEREKEHDASIVAALDFLQTGYARTKRKSGAPAILHPLRTAALLSRCTSPPPLLSLLGALLHDKGEDLRESVVGTQRFEVLEKLFRSFERIIDQNERWYLGERIALLTHQPGDSYVEYLTRMIDQADRMPDLLHVKLADRLDNTFDITLQRPGIKSYNFFRTVFDILFVTDFPGVRLSEYHFLPSKEEGVLLLSQLFKNAIFLSLLRKAGLDGRDQTTRKLFAALAVACIREASWIALEILSSYITDLEQQRELLLDVRQYCLGGGATQARRQEADHPLDGLLQYYVAAASKGRKKRLGELYDDKALLAKLSVVFISLNSRFLNDPGFSLQGVESSGVHPV